MGNREEALALHKQLRGKIEVVSKIAVKDRKALSLAYTPGVAAPCEEIYKNPELVYEYTAKGNLVAVVSDGSAVLGLGNIGPEAALPVMEGKALLFKEFANVDAIPLCVATQDVDEIVQLVTLLEPTLGGVNLEDISAPRCVEIEAKLKERLSIPVFHDDQHGTAVIVTAALMNALRVVEKKINEVSVVINGDGAAGSAIAKMLVTAGVTKLKICDSRGILVPGHERNHWLKEELANLSNPEGVTGKLVDAMKNADVLVGVSKGNIISAEMVRSMNTDAIVFAMANPTPEIHPDEAKAGGARVVGTGRSDFPNQINNVLAFPGIFRGALDVQASEINEPMKLAAAMAIAGLVEEDELNAEWILPEAFDERLATAVSQAVAKAAIETGVAKKGKA
ncbi:malate dehydrogenase [Gottschalkiaceae bacterium SANA]|nr:malate dehydrogenase [Gottschalkiaceae bacterium SANA]